MKTEDITAQFTRAIAQLKEQCPIEENLFMWTAFIAAMNTELTNLRIEVEDITASNS